MKNIKILGLVSLLLLPVFLWAGIARAQSFRTGDNSTVAAGEVVTSSLYSAGRNIDIAGEVDGDVFCAGQNITISGTVSGDVICAGQTVHISGTVRGDARVAGQTVTINGAIEGSLSAGAQNFSLASDGSIGRDAGIGGDEVVLNGPIGRDAAVGSTAVTFGSQVGRNATVDSENVNVRDHARIGGDLSYTSINRANIAGGAQIAGNTKFNEKIQKEDKGGFGNLFIVGLGIAIFLTLAFLITALVLVLLLPSVFHQSAKRALAAPLKPFLVGLLANLAAPILIVGLMMTVIGIPLGLLLLLVWLLVLALSGPFFGYLIGRVILRKQANPVLIMFVGALAVYVASFIPIAGIFVWLAIIWVGSGMVLREIYHRAPKPSYDLGKKG